VTRAVPASASSSTAAAAAAAAATAASACAASPLETLSLAVMVTSLLLQIHCSSSSSSASSRDGGAVLYFDLDDRSPASKAASLMLLLISFIRLILASLDHYNRRYSQLQSRFSQFSVFQRCAQCHYHPRWISSSAVVEAVSIGNLGRKTAD